jgi:hypothetical protein
MAMTIAERQDYERALRQWMRGARLGRARGAHVHFDGILTWIAPGGEVRYLVEEKRHFRNQDVRVIVEQLKRFQHELPAPERKDRVLLVAPHIRPQQANVLEKAGIDYLDLVGNAHLTAPGFFVHVEGRQPAKEAAIRPVRFNKAWVKTVMALLVRRDLETAAYRALAEQADVALGTVAACLNDLTNRGLLRKRTGKRHIVDRGQLLALWIQAYVDVLRPKLRERRFQVRVDAKPDLWNRLAQVLPKHGIVWGLTGADASERLTHFFRAEETEIYAPIRALEDRAIQKELGAQPAARVGNLLVIEPPGPLALPPPAHGPIPVAPELLAYAELRYRGTAQALEAAEILLPEVLGHDGR